LTSGKGWFKDSYRHYLAAKGIKTGYYARRSPIIYRPYKPSLADRISKSTAGFFKGVQNKELEREKVLVSPEVIKVEAGRTALLEQAARPEISEEAIEERKRTAGETEVSRGTAWEHCYFEGERQ
jgi:hypothetical protein